MPLPFLPASFFGLRGSLVERFCPLAMVWFLSLLTAATVSALTRPAEGSR